jgi:hypothetical protein
MRAQRGTSSLRALVYFDEIAGFLPPVANPPSKAPLMTLLKQGRAFGLGVVLATQNPVDLDYKGLGNAGTWFIGRLQTERDKNRVVEGLLGTEAAGGMDRASLEALMSNLTQRTFLMRNVHDDAPVLFRTRWALSYLRGPLTLAEIKRLTDAGGRRAPGGPAASASTARTPSAGPSPASSAAAASSRPVLQAGVAERFVRARTGATAIVYQPRIGANVRTHFVDTKAGMNAWEESYYLAPLEKDAPDWSQAEVLAAPGPEWDDEPREDARFAEVPASALSPRNQRAWSGALADHVYRTASLNIMSCPALKMTAAPGGTEGEFRAHIAQALREKRDAAVDALRARIESRLATLQDRERRAEQKLERERTQASSETLSSALSVGGSLLGALFGGRRSSAMRKASTAARSVGRASKERGDVAHAEADVEAIKDQVATMQAELEAEISRIDSEFDPNTIRVEIVPVRPKKSDLSVEDMALVWCP